MLPSVKSLMHWKQWETEGGERIIYNPFASPWISSLIYFCFLCILLSVFPWSACQSGGWHSFFLSSHSFLLFYFLIAPISFLPWSWRRHCVLVACLRVTLICPVRFGLLIQRRGKSMNEFATHRPFTSPLYSKILPSSFFLSTCSSATSCHTFPLVCAYVSESVLV